MASAVRRSKVNVPRRAKNKKVPVEQGKAQARAMLSLEPDEQRRGPLHELCSRRQARMPAIQVAMVLVTVVISAATRL